jgi:hypothetical protein
MMMMIVDDDDDCGARMEISYDTSQYKRDTLLRMIPVVMIRMVLVAKSIGTDVNV